MPDNLLNSEIIDQLTDIFNSQMNHPVEVILFTSHASCGTCPETNQLLGEVASITDKIHLSIHEIDQNLELARLFNVNLAPAIVLTGRDDDNFINYAFHFYGIPSGYEFSSLIQGIIFISKRESGLQEEIRLELSKIKRPVNLKVFVTPT